MKILAATRTLEADSQQLQAAACDLLFAPSAFLICTPTVKVNIPLTVVNGLSEQLSGEFDRLTLQVATVVSRLFNIVQPHTAFLVKRPAISVIRCLTAELAFDIHIVGVATQRADDGLALSSPNGYLSEGTRT
ncbi:MAG: 4-phosphopantoate--beta-alanine ligase [Moraxellaceae bacterium]|nr:4-phosphopantoate--beta-alanine ligase [Moraxellaceae bacterium]